MIKFLFLAKKLIGKLQNRVIESKRVWIDITRKLVRYVDFSTMLNFQNKFLFQQLLFLEGCFDKENIVQITQDEHELALG